MIKKILGLAAAALLVGLFASLGSSVLAAKSGPRALITQPINNAQTIILYGNTRPKLTPGSIAAVSLIIFRSITCCCS